MQSVQYQPRDQSLTRLEKVILEKILCKLKDLCVFDE